MSMKVYYTYKVDPNDPKKTRQNKREASRKAVWSTYGGALLMLFVIALIESIFQEIGFWSALMLFAVIGLIVWIGIKNEKANKNGMNNQRTQSFYMNEIQPKYNDYKNENSNTQPLTEKKLINLEINNNEKMTLQEINIKEENSKEEVDVKPLEDETLYCRFCGKKIPSIAAYCNYCGKKLN